MDLSTFYSLILTLSDFGAVLFLGLEQGKAFEMGSEQLSEFERLCEILEGPSQVRALITYSTKRSRRGTPIFVAGANVNERVGWTNDRVKEHVSWQRRVLNRVRHIPVFTLAVVEGVALGWGTEYMLVCDYRIATDSASFALPETGLGILPGAGGTSDLWAHVGVAQTLRLGMTGESLSGTQAQAVGLVQETVATVEEGLARAESLANRAALRSPTALAAFKAGVLASVGSGPNQRMAIEEAAYARCVDHGDAAIGREHFAAIRKGEPAPWPARDRDENSN